MTRSPRQPAPAPVAALPRSDAELSVRNHDRDVAGLCYVYAVVSRRAGGVSLGINLNPNNACNYRCIYCQVPDLTAGTAPPVDRDLLRTELAGFLTDLLDGDWLVRHAPVDHRVLRDVAFSGNGEPTSARAFADVVDDVAAILADRGLLGQVPLRLITNGSLCHRPAVQRGLARLNAHGGEVWFKVDAVTPVAMARINSAAGAARRIAGNVRICAASCRTWLQTCVFALDGAAPAEAEVTAYLDFLAGLVAAQVPLAGVLLYTVARPSLQPEADRIASLDAAALAAIAGRIEACGVTCRFQA